MVRRRHSSVKDVLCSNVATTLQKMCSISRHEDPLTYSAQRLGLYIADTEASVSAVNTISTKNPSTSSVKSDTVASLKNSFLDVSKDGLGQCTVTKATLTLTLRLSTDCGARA